MKIVIRIDEEATDKFSPSAGNIFEVDLTSISVLGISMYSKYYLPNGLRIILDIDGKPFGLERSMNLKGEMRYCKQIEASKYKCGIKFIKTADEYKNKIAEFVTANEKKRKL